MPTLHDIHPGQVAWRISTRSGSGGGNCVEAGPVVDGSERVAVRHSRHPDREMLAYTSAEWRKFLDRVHHGAYDL